MPVAAPLIGAAAGIGGSLLAGSASKKAANTAANAQTQAAQLGVNEQARQFNISQQNLQPWLQTGTQALGAQGNLLGLNGDPQQAAAIAALQGSPLYQSLYRNGQDAVLANASATGGLRGGNTQNSLANFGADTLSQVIQQQLANLGGLSSTGQQTGNALGQLGANTANQISGLYGQQGAATAGGALANGAIGANTTNNIFSSLGGLFSNPAISGRVGGMFGGGGAPTFGGGAQGNPPNVLSMSGFTNNGGTMFNNALF